MPVVIPMITGGISGWYINGMRLFLGILMGIPIGIANIFWHWFWAFWFWKEHTETFDALQAFTLFEEMEFQVAFWAVGMVIMAAAMVGFMLLVGHLQKSIIGFEILAPVNSGSIRDLNLAQGLDPPPGNSQCKDQISQMGNASYPKNKSGRKTSSCRSCQQNNLIQSPRAQFRYESD